MESGTTFGLSTAPSLSWQDAFALALQQAQQVHQPDEKPPALEKRISRPLEKCSTASLLRIQIFVPGKAGRKRKNSELGAKSKEERREYNNQAVRRHRAKEILKKRKTSPEAERLIAYARANPHRFLPADKIPPSLSHANSLQPTDSQSAEGAEGAVGAEGAEGADGAEPAQPQEEQYDLEQDDMPKFRPEELEALTALVQDCDDAGPPLDDPELMEQQCQREVSLDQTPAAESPEQQRQQQQKQQEEEEEAAAEPALAAEEEVERKVTVAAEETVAQGAEAAVDGEPTEPQPGPRPSFLQHSFTMLIRNVVSPFDFSFSHLGSFKLSSMTSLSRSRGQLATERDGDGVSAPHQANVEQTGTLVSQNSLPMHIVHQFAPIPSTDADAHEEGGGARLQLTSSIPQAASSDLPLFPDSITRLITSSLEPCFSASLDPNSVTTLASLVGGDD